MSLEQYNSLISGMLNQQYTLAKLRAKIEGREGRVCWECKRFRHLIHNCRNRKGEMKGKPIPQNKFEVIASRVMQCRVKEEVRRQEMKEKKVQCFRCWEKGHYRWEYSNIKVEKEKRSSEKAVHVVSLQKAQQEERPAYSLWRKAQEYSSIWGMPPRSTALEQRG